MRMIPSRMGRYTNCVSIKSRLAALCYFTLFGVAGLAALPSFASAVLCSRENNNHCYAIFKNGSTFEGTWVDLLTSDVEVYDWKESSFVTNETWAGFPDGGWVEDGDYTGKAEGSEGKYPRYFYATEEPVGSEHFYKYVFSTGPKDGEWFYVQEQDEGDGTWCAWVNGGEVYCDAGLPLYSPDQQAGLEAAADIQPYDYGTIYAWGMELGTGDWNTWNNRSYSNANYNGEYDKYCIFPVEGSSSWYRAAFGTPNENPSCLPDQEDLVQGGESVVPPTPPGIPAASGVQAQPAPVEAGYTVPSSATLSSTQLQTVTKSVAQNAGDIEASSSNVQAVSSSLRDAMGEIDPSETLPANPTAGYANWLENPTYLLVLHGHFALNNEPLPPGAATPEGSVLDVIINAHTGSVVGIHVSNQEPTDLASIGTVQNIG